jgi:hypothetical protein
MPHAWLGCGAGTGAKYGHLPDVVGGQGDESGHDDIHDSKGHVMNERLTLPDHRMITPIATFLMAIALVATLALGFGLRTWTEPASGPSAPAGAVQQVRPAPPQPLVKMGKPW